MQQQGDYSNYLTSGGGSYYDVRGCRSEVLQQQEFRHHQADHVLRARGRLERHDAQHALHHELRFSTPDDWRVRGLLGGFWEDFLIYDQMNFNYLPIPQCDPANLATSLGGGPDCLAAVGPVPGAYANDPSLRVDSNTAFGEDVKRGYRQTAVFTSVDFDIIPKVLTVTAGTRYYHYDEFEQGSEFYSESANPLEMNHPNGSCIAAGGCGFPINLNKTEHGFRSRYNITYHITPDIMTYATYSQGFRPGGFNRTDSQPGLPPSLSGEAPFTAGDKSTDQYNKPAGYGSDKLINMEIGSKAELLDRRLIVNASAYVMHWSNVQYVFFDPVHLGNTTFDVNGPSYTIKGAELQVAARITEGLTVQGSGSWNSSEQTNAPCLESNRDTATNPTPIGECIHTIKGQPYTNPYGVLGTPLTVLAGAGVEYPRSLRVQHQRVQALCLGGRESHRLDGEPACELSATDSTGNDDALVFPRCLDTPPTMRAGGVTKDNWTVQVDGQQSLELERQHVHLVRPVHRNRRCRCVRGP